MLLLPLNISLEAHATSIGYVIITTNTIMAQSDVLDDFIHQKELRGYQVHVITEDDFESLDTPFPNGRCEKIRQWLLNHYLDLNIHYALLIGDPDPALFLEEIFHIQKDTIPMKLMRPLPMFLFPRRSEAPTDYYYAALTSDWNHNKNFFYGESTDYGKIEEPWIDLTADVYVGRIPVYNNNVSALDRILEKTITYENEEDTSWRCSVLLPMSWVSEDTDGADLAEQMLDDYLIDSGFSYWRMYQQGSAYDTMDSRYESEEELRDYRVVSHWKNHSYGLVCYFGHGSSNSVVIGYDRDTDGYLLRSEYCNELKDDHPAIVFENSCSNGHPEHENNLGYALLKQGAIATVSATRISSGFAEYGEFNSFDGSCGIAYRFFQYLVQHNQTLGEALYKAKDIKYSMSTLYTNALIHNLYGDPSLRLFNE